MDREPVNVLLVEEDRDYAAKIASWLASATLYEYHVERVSTLANAIIMLKSQPFKLVLLDLKVENGQGVAMVGKLREVLDDDFPLVVFTGMDDEKVEEEAIKARATEFFYKRDIDPTDPDRCLQRILRCAMARHGACRFCQKSNEPIKELGEALQSLAKEIDADRGT